MYRRHHSLGFRRRHLVQLAIGLDLSSIWCWSRVFRLLAVRPNWLGSRDSLTTAYKAPLSLPIPVFHFDENLSGDAGPICLIGQENVDPGRYIVLRLFTSDLWQRDHYRTRVCNRDPCCLVSGLQVVRGNFSHFKAAHIFPRAYDHEICLLHLVSFYWHVADMHSQWVRRGYPSLITDRESLGSLGWPLNWMHFVTISFRIF